MGVSDSILNNKTLQQNKPQLWGSLENGKENGNNHIRIGIYLSYIGIMEKKMEATKVI